MEMDMEMDMEVDMEVDSDTPDNSLLTLAGIPDIQEHQIPGRYCIPEDHRVLHSAPQLAEQFLPEHATSDHVSEHVTEDGLVEACSSSARSIHNSAHSTHSSVHSALSSDQGGSESREPSDDADSGVLCQSSTGQFTYIRYCVFLRRQISRRRVRPSFNCSSCFLILLCSHLYSICPRSWRPQLWQLHFVEPREGNADQQSGKV